MSTTNGSTAVAPVSNDAEDLIALTRPYRVSVAIEGESTYLYHRYSPEAVAEQAGGGKGSKVRKTDNVESYVYRDADGTLAIPGIQLRAAICGAARYLQDPRSPRKSAMDLFKAIVISLTENAPVGKTTWDFLDQQRAVVMRSAITRVRPALLPGWKAEFILMVTRPEYLAPEVLRRVINDAGQVCGLGDFRPTYGRFGVNKFELLTD